MRFALAACGLDGEAGAPATRISPETPRRTPNSASSNSRWPCPSRPPRPTTSPASAVNEMSRSRSVQLRFLTSSSGVAPFARGGRLRRKDVAIFTPDHHLDDLVVGLRSGRVGRDIGAVPEHRAFVGELGDLVHAMGNVTAAPAPPGAGASGPRTPWRRRRRSSAEVASSRMRTRGLRASALAISTICRRDSGRSLTSAIGWMSGAPARSSASSARRRCARRSIIPKRRGGLEMAMLSATERSGTSESSWKMQTMPARLAAAGESKATSAPSSTMRPASGATTPERILISVDLPAPFSPRMAWMRPGKHGEIGVGERAHAAVALGHALHAQDRRGRRLLLAFTPPVLAPQDRATGPRRAGPAAAAEDRCPGGRGCRRLLVFLRSAP